jgi:hypothetical protein
MNWESFKHRLWGYNRFWIAILGLVLLKLGRRILKWSGVYCSWCGRDPGMASTYSRKGLRCDSYDTSCIKEP